MKIIGQIKKIIFLLFIAFGAFILGNQAKAETTTIKTSSNITMVGAQIRTSGVQGLRFIARVDLNEFLNEQAIELENITKYGFVVSFGEASKDNLFLGNTINNKKVLSAESDSLFNGETGDFTVVLYNIANTRLLQGFSARGYIKYNDGEEKIAYSSEIITRSIYEVAKKAIEETSSSFVEEVVFYVDNNLCANVKTISDVKALYNESGDQSVNIKGVVTSVSSGTYLNLTLEDETGAIMLYNKADSRFNNILSVGNEVVLSGTVTKYNGLYEIKSMTNAVLVNSGVCTSDLVIDVAIPFETDDIIYQGKVVNGFIQFISSSDKKITFKTSNEASVLMYVDQKWSEFTIPTLEENKYYYVNGFISNYNGIQLIPYDSNNAVISIVNIEIENLKENYLLGDFDYNDLRLKVTLSDESIKYFNVTKEMITNEDILSLETSGNKTITISYLGYDNECNFVINEKEIACLELASGSFDCIVGDSLDLNDISINVKYIDEDILNVKVTEEMISGFDSTSNGTKELTITYQTKELSVSYNVLKPIVIYEIYGGGGNSNAKYQNDYFILYNNTNQKISLSNYRLLYASSQGSSFSGNYSLSGTIYPKSYFVVKGKSNGTNGSEVELFNLEFATLDASASAGRVALCLGEVPSSVDSENLIDNVLYSKIDKTQSYQRTSFINDDFTSKSADLSYLLSMMKVSDISVTGIKSNYRLGESLDLNSAKINVAYQNGSVRTVDIKESDVTGFKTTSIGSFAMTITYQEALIIINYTVTSNEGLLDVEIYFIDLGDNIDDCGESTYIKVGDDIDILIDAGENSTVSAKAITDIIDAHCTDETLEYVIASHAHSDHIGGMRYVLPNYNIVNVIEFDYKYGATEASSSVIGYYLKARSKAENIVTAYELISNQGNGSSYVWSITEGISFTFYESGFLNTTGSDKNQQSVICVFEAYGTRVLFNGDGEKQCETNYAPLVGDVDILKVAHHGTYNATTKTLLENVKPEVAIVCNGNYLGNEYGHPTYDALSRIYNYNDETLIYAITGATINSMVVTTSNGPGSSKYTLYAYKTSSRYNFYFNCATPAEAMGQRNGNIIITIHNESYTITSEYGGNSPFEMRNTDYWNNMVSYISSN